MTKSDRTVLHIEDVKVRATGEDVRLTLASREGDQRDLIIPLDGLGQLVELLMRVHLDAKVARAAPPREWEIDEEYRPPAETLHVTDIAVSKWEAGGAAFRLRTIEGRDVVAAFMPDKIRFLRETLRQHFDGPERPATKDTEPLPSVPPIFPGQAPGQEEFQLKDESENVIDPMQAAFPLVKRRAGGAYEFVGTGFFVAPEGVFATARHVLDELSNDVLPSDSSLLGVHFLDGDQCVLRPIVNYSVHAVADVGVGKLADVTDPDGRAVANKQLVLAAASPHVGDPVFMYAYPHTTRSRNQLSFSPRYYHGTLEEEHPNGRDKHLLPGACYRTSIVLHGGASGGPVFGTSGRVFGINSTGYKEMRLSFVSRIVELLDVELDQVRYAVGEEPRRVCVRELAERGIVLMR